MLWAPTFRGGGLQLTWGTQWEMWAELGMEKRLETEDEEAGCEHGFTARDGELARMGVVHCVGDG